MGNHTERHETGLFHEALEKGAPSRKEPAPKEKVEYNLVIV